MTSKKALKWLYAGHLFDAALEDDSDGDHGTNGDPKYCGFCAVIRDSIGLGIFKDLSIEELTEGIHPLMHYLLENDKEPAQ